MIKNDKVLQILLLLNIFSFFSAFFGLYIENDDLGVLSGVFFFNSYYPHLLLYYKKN